MLLGREKFVENPESQLKADFGPERAASWRAWPLGGTRGPFWGAKAATNATKPWHNPRFA